MITEEQIIQDISKKIDKVMDSPIEVLPLICMTLEKDYRNSLKGSDKKRLALLILQKILDVNTDLTQDEISSIMSIAGFVIDTLVYMGNKGYKVFKKHKICSCIKRETKVKI
jgi:hypothetical protein